MPEMPNIASDAAGPPVDRSLLNTNSCLLSSMQGATSLMLDGISLWRTTQSYIFLPNLLRHLEKFDYKESRYLGSLA